MKHLSPPLREDDMDDQSFADKTQTVQVLRGDQLLQAAKLLEQEEFLILKLHDIEGHSLDELVALTGLPLDVVVAQIDELRSRFVRHIEAEARSWSKQVKILEEDQA